MPPRRIRRPLRHDGCPAASLALIAPGHLTIDGHRRSTRTTARRRPPAVSLTRQGRHYLTIGIVQWLLAWGVVVMLSHLGLPVRQANVAGRISGALLGFLLTGRITFAGEHTRVGRAQVLRLLAVWLESELV